MTEISKIPVTSTSTTKKRQTRRTPEENITTMNVNNEDLEKCIDILDEIMGNLISHGLRDKVVDEDYFSWLYNFFLTLYEDDSCLSNLSFDDFDEAFRQWGSIVCSIEDLDDLGVIVSNEKIQFVSSVIYEYFDKRYA